MLLLILNDVGGVAHLKSLLENCHCHMMFTGDI